MAEFWMEGFLHRLLDDDDPTSGALRRHATLYVVPNMNPDGSRRGHLRTNACGANLNREWQSPTRERSPEVLFVRQRMVETGVALSLDVHGDEALPYNFIAGPDGIPNLRPGQLDLVESFKADLAALSPDFQTEHGYPRAAPGQANLTMCTNWVAERFGCPAMTLEMPFKDTAGTPHRAEGWSPQRSAALGRSCLDALARILPQLPRDV
jgi:murein tripeptide amidase MpaA